MVLHLPLLSFRNGGPKIRSDFWVIFLGSFPPCKVGFPPREEPERTEPKSQTGKKKKNLEIQRFSFSEVISVGPGAFSPPWRMQLAAKIGDRGEVER